MRATCLILIVVGACGPDATGGSGADDVVTTSATDATTVNDTSTASDTSNASDATAPSGGATWFSQPMPWTRPVDDLEPAPESAAIIGDLEDQGGWGNGDLFQIDFSIEVLEADAATPRLAFETTDDWFETECDHVPVPLPAGGALEGEEGYACASDGDCHLIVRDGDARLLYEMWRANFDGEVFYGGCLAVWDLDRAHDDDGRGRGCTSADAAGLPIAPLLFTAEEVEAGLIDHAIRFILPNARIRHRVYVAPATHSTGATGGGEDAPPYGVRLRLRADYPIDTLPSTGARVVARALQRYGMFLADAGQIALTARSDRYGSARWDGLLGPREVVELGPASSWDGDCRRIARTP